MPKNTTKKVTKKSVPVVVPVVQTSTVVPVKTESEKIWNEIKDLPLQMFGLPNQVVSQHCVPVQVDPTRLFLTIRSTSTLPALETALGTKFTVELADKFVIVARPINSLFQPKR